MLDPPPRDFTATSDLTEARVLSALEQGRPGTGMKPFTGILTTAEQDAVAHYVVEAFARCGRPAPGYHTVANGWPEHADRYAAALGYAQGKPIASDIGSLGLTPPPGQSLFLGACITCHEAKDAEPVALGLYPRGSLPGETNREEIEHYGAPSVHDRLADIVGLSDLEKAGRALWIAACADCHAADGTGRNWVGRFLDPSPPDFTDAKWHARMDEAQFAERTISPPAGTAMPSFRGVLTPEDARAIASFVYRAFAPRN